jgi:molybdate transport system regulatory protein
MNRSFRQPLVTTATGGNHGGGAHITDFGRNVLQRYRAIEAKASAAVDVELNELRALLTTHTTSS